MVIEQAQRTIQDIQSEYDSIFRTEPIRDDDSGYVWHAREVLKAKPGLNAILDIACGGGFFLDALRRELGRPCFLAGMDISPEAIGIARRQSAGGRYAVGVAEQLPFADASFDAVTCLGSLEHFLDVKRAVEEMQRVLKKGGVIYVLVPNMFWYKDILSVLWRGDRKTRNQTHERFASLGEWKTLLEALGLTVIKVKKYNGIARYRWKQWMKDLLIPLRFSYHLVFLCRGKEPWSNR